MMMNAIPTRSFRLASLSALLVALALPGGFAHANSLILSPSNVVVAESYSASVQVRLSEAPEAALDVSVSRSGGDPDIQLESGQTLHFSADNWDSPQEMRLAAGADSDSENGSATFHLRGEGVQTAELIVQEADEAAAIALIAEETRITVGEKNYAAFRIRLAEQPPGEIVLRASRQSGDSDLRFPTLVRCSTVLGTFDLALYEQDTPKTVENFLNYVRDGDFNNSFFHRSVPGFIVQTGGFFITEDENGDPKIDRIATDPPVVNEPVRSNLRGTIAMAKLEGDPDSASSGWFVNLADNSENLDFQNDGFSVFGEVLGDGMALADAVAALPRAKLNSPLGSLPVTNWEEGDPVLFENLVALPKVQEIDAAELRFTPENWQEPQHLWVTARRDADRDAGQADFQLEWAGGPRAIEPLHLQADEGERYWINVQTDGPGRVLPTVTRGFNVDRNSYLPVKAASASGYAFSHWHLEPAGSIRLERHPESGIIPADDSTLTAHFAADADGDGLPDRWEEANGFDSSSADDAYEDRDGDGWTTLSEYRRSSDPEQPSLSLEAGWNAVSLGSNAGSELLQTLLDSEGVSPTVWTYQNGRLHPAETIRPGKAYWLRAERATTLALQSSEQNQTSQDSCDLPLRQGWNFIGFQQEPLTPAVVELFDGYPAIHFPVWTWTGGEFQRAERVLPGRGYWVFATQETSVTVAIRP